MAHVVFRGQGTVYRVDFQQQYAVKEVALTDAYKFTLLLKEAKASYKLEHKNLLSSLYRYFDGKKAYLVAQLMDKGDLEDIVKQTKGNLPEAAAAYVVRELLDVLHFLHNDAKTAHRDVKPANVLANSAGEIKLADFGLCGDLTEPRETGLGSPFFMSPEMVIAIENNGNEHDLKVDVWALGVTLFNLLTKQLPFKAPHPKTVYKKILNDDPVDACRRAVQASKTEVALSDECWAFLERCLVKDKDQRADTAELLASAFVKKASPDAWKAVVAPATEA